MIDFKDPTLLTRLKEKTSDGRYVISEIELVLNIREYDSRGDETALRFFCAVLYERCIPMFIKQSQGLASRPELREEAMANMAVRLFKEARDPKEVFLTQNFVHAARCLCVDEFKSVLRQEGLAQRTDENGRPSGRPHHVPRSLMDSIQTPSSEDETPPLSDVADPDNQFEHVDSNEESRRILAYLTDPLDRMIVTLRAIEKWKWEEIAHVCKKTDRTVRSRYDKALTYLRESLHEEGYDALPQF